MSSLLNRWKLNQDLGISNEIKNTDGEFSKGVSRAWENTKATTKAAIGAMGAEDFLIAADFNQREAGRYAPKVEGFTDIRSLSDAGDWLAGTAGESVVNLGTLAVGGGVGGLAARGATRLLGGAALREAAKVGATAGIVGTSYPQQFGENIQAVRAEHGGALPEGSVSPMALTAVAQTALDTLPVMGVLGKLGLADKARGDILQKTLTSPTRIRQIGRDLGEAALKEGVTEAAQEAMKLGALEWIDSNKDHFGVEQMKQLVDSFAAGAVGGVMMDAPVAGLNALHSDKPWFKQKETMKAEAIKRFEESGDAEQFAADKEAIRSFKDEQLAAEAVQSQAEIVPPVPITPDIPVPEQKLAVQSTVNPMDETAPIQADAPVVVDPVEVAKPNDSPMGFEQGFKDGVKDPVLARAKPYFEAGLINSPNDLRQFENQGYPKLPMPKAVMSETPKSEEVKIDTDRVIPLENPSYEQNTNAQNPLESTEVGQGIPEPRVSDAAILGDLPINKGSTPSSPPSFTPTHELADGTPVVAHPEDQGVWVGQDGSEYESSDTYPIKAPSDPGLVKHQKLIDKYQADTTKVEQSASEAALSPLNNLPEPSLAQKEAGNYKKGMVHLHGLPLAIEIPKGGERKGVDQQGNEWSTTMAAHYGYVRGSKGFDGDPVDVFMGDDVANPNLPVFVVDQVKPDGSFDEHKVMMGYPSLEAAKQGYLANYKAGWTGLGAITPMSLDKFKDLVKSGWIKKPLGKLQKGNKNNDISLPAVDEGIREREALKKQDATFSEYQSIKDNLSKADAVDDMRKLNEGYRQRMGVEWPDYMSSLEEYNQIRGGGFTEVDLVRDRFNSIMNYGSRAAIVEAAKDVDIELGRNIEPMRSGQTTAVSNPVMLPDRDGVNGVENPSANAPSGVTDGDTLPQPMRENQPSVLGLVDAAFEQGKKVVVVAGDAASARLLASEGVLVVKHLSIAQKKLVGVKRLVLDGVSPEQVAKNQRLKQWMGDGMQLVLVSQQPAREVESRLRGIC